MNGRRVHFAWIIIFSSFLACIGLIVIVPIGLNAMIQGATRSLDVTVQANQGTVGVRQSDGEPVAIFAGDPPQGLNPTGSILTNAADTALLLAQTPNGEELIARIQVYGNTSVNILEANTPRFSASSANNQLLLSLDSGRVQLTLPQNEGRPVDVEMRTPQGLIMIEEPGRYSISASNSEAQVAVLQGRADIVLEDDNLVVETDRRVVIPSGGTPIGPLGSERNLIKNGDFGDDFEEWVLLAPNIELSDQSKVDVQIETDADEPAIQFKRVGIGHADAGMRQIINQDLTDFESLQLVVSLVVGEQSLGVCGEQGSECPLIVRIEYDDINGVSQTWQQGFYAVGEISPSTPDICVACPPPLNEHQSVPFQQLAFYESDNLIERLDLLGILPRKVKSVTLIASGHTFDTKIVDIALMARE
jgi:hypothetical protein